MSPRFYCWRGLPYRKRQSSRPGFGAAAAESGPEMDAIKKRMKPGTVLVTIDLPATPDTRSDKNFVVMDGRSK